MSNRKLYLATFSAVLGPLSFGFVLGYSSPAIPDLCKVSNPRLQLDAEQASWFGSVVTLGAALGGVVGGWIVEKVGRKLSLMFCSMPFIFGFAVIIAAENVWMLYVGRIFTGVASGVTSLVVPLYISEISHARVRGTIGTCVQLMVVSGIMGAYAAGLALDWRWLAVTCSVPPTLMLVLMCFMPETPRFLLSQGKRKEAEEALGFLRGPQASVQWECDQIDGVTQDQGGKFQLSHLLDPGVYRPLAVGVLMMLYQQFTGINAIMFYAETIFEDASFKGSDVATVIVAVVQVVFTAVAAMLMDRVGRKVLLILSGIAMSVSTGVFGLYFKYFKLTSPVPVDASDPKFLVLAQDLELHDQHKLAWIAVASMGLFIAGFALGWGPTPWLVMSEIFPIQVRGFASAICVLINWTAAFIVTKTFQDLTDLLGRAGIFWLFSGLCAMNVLFTIFCVPETKGKTLEQIHAHFRGTD